MKIMASGPITYWQINGEKVEIVTGFISLGSKITVDGDYSHRMKRRYFLGGASQVVLVVKNPPASAGDIRDMGSIPGSGRSPGEGNGNLLLYSCLENPMDRGAGQGTVHKVAKSWT